jgi:multiple sugar transport system permease protein
MGERTLFDLHRPLARLVFRALLAGFVIFLLGPIVWMVLTSLKPNTEIFVQFPSVVPRRATLASYARALAASDIVLYLRNSVVTAGGSALITTALAALAAYGFAKYRFFGRRGLMLGMIAAQMVPFGLILIGLYPVLAWVHLLNTRLGLTLSYIVLALPPGIYMMYAFFIRVPNEIIEAARVDGAGELAVLGRIILPVSLPALISVGMYALMWAWNDLLYALTLTTSDGLRTIGPGLLLRFFGEMQQDWGAAMAASIMASLPIVLLFAWLQRYFLQGFTVGAVKG